MRVNPAVFLEKQGDIREKRRKYELNLKVYYPKWGLYKKSAPIKRNTPVAKKSDIVIACVAKDRTGGTEDTIKKFKRFVPNGEIILC